MRLCTVLAAKVRHCHILQGDLPQKGGTLAAWISCDNTAAPKPHPKPRKTAVTVERIGQKIPDEGNQVRITTVVEYSIKLCVCVRACVCHLQGGQVGQRVKGSRQDGVELIVIQ